MAKVSGFQERNRALPSVRFRKKGIELDAAFNELIGKYADVSREIPWAKSVHHLRTTSVLHRLKYQATQAG